MRTFNYDKKIYKYITPQIINLLSLIHEYKGRQQLFIQAKPDILKSMLEVAKIQSTGASNRIEGIYTTDARLKELVKNKTEPRNRSEQEITGYREVLNTIHENYEFIPVNANTILQLHRDLYVFNAFTVGGNYKKNDNIIEETDTKGNKRIRFNPVSAYETPESIINLCDEYNRAINIKEVDPLLLIPLFILDFLCIHPFNDGNGRMSRLLTLMLLYKENYTVGKYISLEMIIEKTKDRYYDTLERSSKNWHEDKNNIKHFIKYYLEVILKAYREFDSRVNHISASKKITKQMRIKNLFDTTLGKLSKSDIAQKCPDISVTTIEKTLYDLLKEEYIMKLGKGRATKYIRNHGE